MNDQDRCEYLVVGSGAGGSVAAALIAEAGRDVMVIEEGERWTPDLTTTIGAGTRRLYRNGGVFPFLGAPVIPFAEGRCVGGSTIINGGLIWRTPSWVLESWSKENGLTGYDEPQLRKHFETVERDLHVVPHTLEQHTNLDSGALYRGAKALGWNVAMAPRAVKHCNNSNRCPIGGCPGCGKQSMAETYLPRALSRGARLLSNCRAVKIIHENGRAIEVLVRHENRLRAITFDHLVLAGGAIQTPHLLAKSGLRSIKSHPVQFHMNLKVVALYPEEIRAHRGTIFTTQVQEFARDGILMMATNLAPHYLALTLARHGADAMNQGLRQYAHAAIFTAMVRAKSKAHVVSVLGDQPLVWYAFDTEDLSTIRLAIRRTAEALFASGARELYLPIRGSAVVASLAAVDRVLEKLTPGVLDIVTVHIMASCPMGPSAAASVVRPDGRLWSSKNIIVADASILPSNIGESPQGTIMAFVHELIGRHLGP